MRTALLLAPLLVADMASPPVARADDTARAQPALWSVSDADTTITLFGTMHLMRPEVDWFHGRVEEAFDDADELVLEVLPGDPAEEEMLVAMHGLDDSGVALRSKLDRDDRKRYDAAMRSLALPREAFDPMKPWLAAVTLAVMPMLQAGYSPDAGIEEVLSTAALDQGKRMTGLETAEQQLGFFDAIPETSQLDMLNDTVREFDRIADMTSEMDALWSAGRAERLGVLVQTQMKGQTDDESLYRILLTDRNRDWARWVESRMARPGAVFLAVGAAHLVGEGSLIERLEASGHEVRRVRLAGKAMD